MLSQSNEKTVHDRPKFPTACLVSRLLYDTVNNLLLCVSAPGPVGAF